MTNVQLKNRWGPLALVTEPASEPAPQVSFCSHCGSPPDPESNSRVCGECELGLLLTAAAFGFLFWSEHSIRLLSWLQTEIHSGK